MKLSEKKLNNKIDHFQVEVKGMDVCLYTANILRPLLRYNGEIEVSEVATTAIISQKPIEVSACLPKFSIVRENRGVSIVSSKTESYINGEKRVYDNFVNGHKACLEIVLPKFKKNATLEFESLSGDLEVSNATLSGLVAKIISGDINLTDVNILFTSLETMSGDIQIEILESIANYTTYVHSLTGEKSIETIEKKESPLLTEKHVLKVDTMNGSTNILFKGRK